MKLNDNIRFYRRKSGLTQNQTAELLSVSVQTVSRWEIGESMPDSSIIPKIADIFNISLDELFDRHPVGESHLIKTIYDDMKEISNDKTLWECPKKIREIRKIALISELMSLVVEKYDIIDSLLLKYHLPHKINSFNGSMEDVCDGGFTFSSNRKDLPFYSVFEEPENGFNIVFENLKEYSNTFYMLSDPEVLQAISVLYSQKDGIVFDSEYAKTVLNIKSPEDTLPKIVKLRILSVDESSVDGKNIQLYVLHLKCGIIALFAMLNEYLFHNNSFDHGGNSRTKPYVI